MVVTAYTNPIRRGMYPDPSIVRVGDIFYMVNSTFEYYPGISVSRSSDLVNWETLPSVVQNSTQADLRNANSNEGIFAVCIRFNSGHFYVITTNFAEWKTFIIRGTYDNKSNNIVWNNKRVEIDINGIDPDLFFENGHTYVQYTGYVAKGKKAISQVEIDLDTGKLLTEPKVLTYGTGGRDVEGPHIIRKNDWYYLLTAEGGTGSGHMITIFRSKNLWGPYSSFPSNPLFTNRDNAEEPLQNIGHGDLFKDTLGNWWLTCLGTRPVHAAFKEFTTIGRETLLYPVSWEEDWPLIYNGTPKEKVDLTNFPQHRKVIKNSQELTDFEDTFSDGLLKPDWLSLRASLGMRLKLASGSLTLHGSEYGLQDKATPSFIGLRQHEQEELFEVELNRDTTDVTQGEIGVAITINNTHYACLLLKKVGGGYELRSFIKDEDLEVSKVIGKVRKLPRFLTITSSQDKKILTAAFEQGSDLSFETSALHFSNEAICALNTGDITGVFAIGDSVIGVKRASCRSIK